MDSLITKTQAIIAAVLMVLLILVIALSTIHLCVLLGHEVWKPPRFLIPVQDLVELFGYFLLVLIGVELLETLKGYIKKNALHARVVLEVDGKKQARFAKGGGSYASANDPRHVFGLGPNEKIDKVTVTWPDLTEQTWQGLAVDRYWDLVEGEKDARPAKAPR